MAKWRAQVVGNRIGESFQFLVARLEICRLLGEFLIEIIAISVPIVIPVAACIARVTIGRCREQLPEPDGVILPREFAAPWLLG
jgi:hypothetical protein